MAHPRRVQGVDHKVHVGQVWRNALQHRQVLARNPLYVFRCIKGHLGARAHQRITRACSGFKLGPGGQKRCMTEPHAMHLGALTKLQKELLQCQYIFLAMCLALHNNRNTFSNFCYYSITLQHTRPVAGGLQLTWPSLMWKKTVAVSAAARASPARVIVLRVGSPGSLQYEKLRRAHPCAGNWPKQHHISRTCWQGAANQGAPRRDRAPGRSTAAAYQVGLHCRVHT